MKKTLCIALEYRKNDGWGLASTDCQRRHPALCQSGNDTRVLHYPLSNHIFVCQFSSLIWTLHILFWQLTSALISLAHLSSVIRLFVFKLFTFSFSSPEALGQIQLHSWVRGIQVCSNQGLRPFPRGDKNKWRKYIVEIYKSFSPEPLGQFYSNLAQSILEWRRLKVIRVIQSSKRR